MDYNITDAIDEAKRQLSEELEITEEQLDIYFKKIIYTFVRL